jgi:hypothetical protein
MTGSEQYLIIGGSTKCATTSVFNYFQFHPDVCPCVMKESRYFLESGYVMNARERDHSSVPSFGALFKGCSDGQVRLEATPDYLYSASAMERIKSELEHIKVVFILRDPVDRLISWHRFALLNGMVDREISFDRFVEMQVTEPDAGTPQHLRALVQGRYSGFIENYISRFGRSSVLICYYEDLKTDPRKFCSEISVFADVDPGYFSNYKFEVHNKSVSVKSVKAHQYFRKVRRAVRPLTRMFPDFIREKLKLAGSKAEMVYTLANKEHSGEATSISDHTMTFLREYYSGEANNISLLKGVKPHWNYIQQT